MKKPMKKITLAKETLRNLAEPDIATAQGGVYTYTLFNSCYCPTLSCLIRC